MDSTPTVANSPTNRSRVSNGTVILEGIDGRSAMARRFRDIFAEVLSDLGGADNVSEGERQLAKRAAGLSVGCEQIEAAMARSETVDTEDYVRLVNASNRTFSTLGLRRRAKDITPALADYVEARRVPVESDGRAV